MISSLASAPFLLEAEDYLLRLMASRSCCCRSLSWLSGPDWMVLISSN